MEQIVYLKMLLIHQHQWQL